MNEVWVKFIEQAPWAAAMTLIVYLFLRHQREIEHSREANAAAMAKERREAEAQAVRERREYEQQKDAMWATWIKNLIDQQNNSAKQLADALAAHDRASEKRYEKLGVTKDLIQAANKAGLK
jgi:hypothetical protein